MHVLLILFENNALVNIFKTVMFDDSISIYIKGQNAAQIASTI